MQRQLLVLWHSNQGPDNQGYQDLHPTSFRVLLETDCSITSDFGTAKCKRSAAWDIIIWQTKQGRTESEDLVYAHAQPREPNHLYGQLSAKRQKTTAGAS